MSSPRVSLGVSASVWGVDPFTRSIVPPLWGVDPPVWGVEPPLWGAEPPVWGVKPPMWGFERAALVASCLSRSSLCVLWRSGLPPRTIFLLQPVMSRDTTRHNTTRHDTARHGTARHGTARHGAATPAVAQLMTIAKEMMSFDIVTVFLHDEEKAQLWSRWGTRLPTDVASGQYRALFLHACPVGGVAITASSR